MNKTPLDETRMQEILEIYGADENRWPEEARASMADWLKQSESARKHLKAASEFDKLLDKEFKSVIAPSHLYGAVLQDAENLYRSRKWYHRMWQNPSLRPAGGFFAAIIVGIGLGWYSPNLLISEQTFELDEISLSDSVLEWEVDNENS
ncbi:hypothetical protein A9Q83_00245 [Alphaproteobacteria bacterium 46_93_T64]|nr:hypothetical protein A9Q83_00245 [Alphaproteobacteria bacterium 46_93_T64]